MITGSDGEDESITAEDCDSDNDHSSYQNPAASGDDSDSDD